MTETTIVAVFDSAANADAAVRDLGAANVPTGAISREPSQGASGAAPRDAGFWNNLFGGEPDHGSSVYDRSVASGSHIVTVRVPEAHEAAVTAILERHSPVDMDDRAASYGAGTTAMPAATRDGMGTTGAGGAGDEERLQLSEEQINVGKRLVNHGTTRIRRFVVETPVEENVTLHSERVSVERRPVSGDTRTADADFSEKTVEIIETDEEAVIGKTARVREEVVIRKDVSDRVETVRDTVRREDVEITKDGTRRTA